jgi:GNAT superfamily N-acetyltransferase
MTSQNMQTSHQKNTSRRQRGLSISERLAMIGLIEEGLRLRSSDAPVVADLFDQLWQLVDATVSGSTVDKLKSKELNRGFQVFEINAASGENLGRLHTLYLKKPIPCYYLVYVEVAPPFRNKGLGTRILESFGDFLIEKSAIGILDNIIPAEHPAYDLYLKQHWLSAREIGVETEPTREREYMVFVPPSYGNRALKEPVQRLLHHLERKRAAIDMRENELMVARTIEEFKELYAALTSYFAQELTDGQGDALMEFMFTRFVTKLLGFAHRIEKLLGYTGGESLQQIVVDPQVRALPIKSYAPRDLAGSPAFVGGDPELWLKLPEVFKKHPARLIEALPNYRRPNLVRWMEREGRDSSEILTIGDLLDLGFDPTRLKEIEIDGEEYIFERVQARQLEELDHHRAFLENLEPLVRGVRARKARVRVNPPLVIIRDRGNGYVLRKKVAGVHWEEAVEQLQTSESLVALNKSLKIDKLVMGTVRKASEFVRDQVGEGADQVLPRFAFFVSWSLDTNQPILAVDMSGAALDGIWIA